MGVHGLWELLAPVGRRVSVETLAGKKLAIDASIWMVQFMKAMRDEKGEMVKNAHLLGFFRRICKLLFLRTKPVFVFDGGTPALKRRTVIARRRQRENAQAKIRKTAEKLLLNQLKAMKLKELAINLENQKNSKDKGKSVLVDGAPGVGVSPASTDAEFRRSDQEKLDEMLAASLAAEEDQGYRPASTSAAGMPFSEEEDSDGEEEMILPVMHGKVDPTVLASLPPSMQLDLLGQMRERLMAENRQRYQKVKKAPAKFSELQIQSYLKTVAFRREIDEVQKSAAGRGVGGVQTSRIASEANREFIFSSSFTGNKQVLASAGLERNTGKQSDTETERPPSNPLNSIASSVLSNTAATSGTVVDEAGSGIADDVETYLDERGRVRVSRLRAMGIRMTRDLQRNLDLMKEIDMERVHEISSGASLTTSNASEHGVLRSENTYLDNSEKGCNETFNLSRRVETLTQDDNQSKQSVSENGISIEVSFDEETMQKSVGDDDIFDRLAAGTPLNATPLDVPSVDRTQQEKLASDSASDIDWEDGTIGCKVDNLDDDFEDDTKSFPAKNNRSNESDAKWEEGICDAWGNASPSQVECGTAVSLGDLEEQADIQEAIKRSLVDLGNQKPAGLFHGNMMDEVTCEAAVFDEDRQVSGSPFLSVLHQNESVCGLAESKVPAAVAVAPHKGGLVDKPNERVPHSDLKISIIDAVAVDNLTGLMAGREFVHPTEEEFHLAGGCHLGTSHEGGKDSTSPVNCFADGSSGLNAVLSNRIDADLVGACENDSKMTLTCHPHEMTPVSYLHEELSDMKVTNVINKEDKLIEEINEDNNVQGRENDLVATVIRENRSAELERNAEPSYQEEMLILDQKRMHQDGSMHQKEGFPLTTDRRENRNTEFDLAEANLEEEMLVVDQERSELGDEQRKLERNAESVSSEMFAECQELLQLFGLPYIIAPMEAEAQCAFMELTNLVDGVVTDDSDVFLFGARSVYKNIFDDRKYVETYFMKDIESELGLTREKLIRMALLLGSDYTEGVSGVGIVNAIEVVNAFPEEDGLQNFRKWIESPDPKILGKVSRQPSSRKRGSKVNDNGSMCSNDNSGVFAIEEHDFEVHYDNQSDDDVQHVKQIFMDKHRNVSKNWHVPSSFPSEAVISAYISPQVDKSTEPFSWGKPDLSVLRKMCWEKFGWGGQKADELLKPVLKEYNKHETQLRLEAFYTFNERFAKIRSRRIKKALRGTTENKASELVDDAPQGGKSRKKTRGSPFESVDNNENNVDQENGKSSQKRTLKRSRKGHIQEDPPTPDLGNVESTTQAEGSGGRGRRRKRWRRGGRGGRGGRGQKLGRRNSEVTESSSDDDSRRGDKQHRQPGNYEGSSIVQRSARRRKPLNDNSSKLDIDDSDNSDLRASSCKLAGWSHTQSSEEFSCRKAMDEEPECEETLAVVSERDEHDAMSSPHVRQNYFETGGRFCQGASGKETVLKDLSEEVDHSFDADISKEYLKVGGGFCVDEDENKNKSEEGAINPSNLICQDASRPDVCPSTDGPKHESVLVQSFSNPGTATDGVQGTDGTDLPARNPTQPLDSICSSACSLLGKPPELNMENDEKDAEKCLSAMPLLKRKRKKSVLLFASLSSL